MQRGGETPGSGLERVQDAAEEGGWVLVGVEGPSAFKGAEAQKRVDI